MKTGIDIKKIFIKALEDSGMKPCFKWLWYAFVITSIIVLIEKIFFL